VFPRTEEANLLIMYAAVMTQSPKNVIVTLLEISRLEQFPAHVYVFLPLDDFVRVYLHTKFDAQYHTFQKMLQ